MMVNLIPPAIVIYTDDLPEGGGGQANGPVVRIRQKYQHDEGILRHELTHVWQWWLTLFLHSILYLMVRLMSPRYDLGLTAEEARQHLQ